MRMQGKPKGLEGLWILKGQVEPPRHPQLRLVRPAPRLTRVLLRQDLTPHLSKSDVTRLADRGAALGHGTETANLPRGVRFPNDSLWGRVQTGEIQRYLCVQCLASCARLACPNTQEPTVVRKKMDRRHGATFSYQCELMPMDPDQREKERLEDCLLPV